MKEKSNSFKLKNNFQNIISINVHNYSINSVKIFPSGKIISVSNDKSIKIFDGKTFKILQNIKNAHNNWIFYVEVLNENKFITCSGDNSIKIWIKNKEKKYETNNTIKNAHNHWINQVIHSSNENLISCSNDKTIKIWEEKNYKYSEISILKASNSVLSILLLEDQNLLISGGKDGIKFWNIEKIKMRSVKLIKSFEKFDCNYCNGLERLNKNQIIVGGDESIKIISIEEEYFIKDIFIPFNVWTIKVIEEMIFIGGESNDILIYQSNDYELVKTIKNAHYNWIKGFVQLKDGLVGTFSFDKTIKIWKL